MVIRHGGLVFLRSHYFSPPASAAVALLATTKQKLSKTESESLPPCLPLCRICRHGSEVEKIEVLLHDDDSQRRISKTLSTDTQKISLFLANSVFFWRDKKIRQTAVNVTQLSYNFSVHHLVVNNLLFVCIKQAIRYSYMHGSCVCNVLNILQFYVRTHNLKAPVSLDRARAYQINFGWIFQAG